MNWDRIQGNWKQVTGKAKEQWGKLTDDDFDVVAGRRQVTQRDGGRPRGAGALADRGRGLAGRARDVAERDVTAILAEMLSGGLVLQKQG